MISPIKLITVENFQSEIEKYFPNLNWEFGKKSSTGSLVATYRDPNIKYWEFEIVACTKYKTNKIETWLLNPGPVAQASGRTLAKMLSDLKMRLDWKPTTDGNITKEWLRQFPLVNNIIADPEPQPWHPSKEDYELIKEALKKEYTWTKGYLETAEDYKVYFDPTHKIQINYSKYKTEYCRPNVLEVPVFSTKGQKFNLKVITSDGSSFITAR